MWPPRDASHIDARRRLTRSRRRARADNGDNFSCMCYFPEEYRHARAAADAVAPGGERVTFGLAKAKTGTLDDDGGRRMRRASSETACDDVKNNDFVRDGACGAREREHRVHGRSKSMEDADAGRVGGRDARRRDVDAVDRDDARARSKNARDLEMMMFGTTGMNYALGDDRMDGIGDSSTERRRVGYMANGALRDAVNENGCSALESMIRTLCDND